MNTLELTAAGGSLSLKWDEPIWCQVSLLTPKRNEALGADSLKIVKERISRAMDERFLGSPDHTQTLDGFEYSCFISLFEKHASGYARRTADGLILHFRDANGQPIADLLLTRETCERWKAALAQLP